MGGSVGGTEGKGRMHGSESAWEGESEGQTESAWEGVCGEGGWEG